MRYELENDALMAQALSQFINDDGSPQPSNYPEPDAGFTPCLQCTNDNSQAFRTAATPCSMCLINNEGFLCRAEIHIVVREERNVLEDFPQVVESDQVLADVDTNMFEDIYNDSPLLPAAERREPSSFGQGDITQFTGAGEADWALLVPTDDPPINPSLQNVTFSNVFDMGNQLGLNGHVLEDPTGFDIDAILQDPVFNQVVQQPDPAQQVQPRFPLSMEP